MATMAIMARMARNNGENGKKIDGENGKINGEVFFAIFAISPWRKSRKKMANGNEPPKYNRILTI